LPHLYRYYAAGERANHCIDAALTLAAAFGQFGISAQAWPVELVINPADGRAATRYGANPRCDGEDFRGHCVLWLPEQQHFVDVTLEQFAETARQEPLIGRAVLAVDPVTGRGTAVDWAAAGGTAVVQRPTCRLEYTAGTPQQAHDILAAPVVRANAAGHHRAGTNLAAQTVRLLTVSPDVLARARSAPFPRLRRLLDTLTGVPAEADSEGNWRFTVAGPDGPQRLLLDEIPL
jgi:hypothetical protein